MSQPKPESRRWTRISNRVTPTLVTFPCGNSATAKPFLRLSNPVAPTIVTFPRAPVLFITIRRHPESNAALPFIAARLIREASRLEVSHGGHGIAFDPSGSAEEPDKLVLRLIPRLTDEISQERILRVMDELKQAIRNAESGRTPGVLELIDSEVKREDASITMIGVEVDFHLAQ